MDYFVERIRAYIKEKELIKENDHVIIGLSGGADSVCLLLVLKSLQTSMHFSMKAIHVHHGIRKDSANRDMEFSKALCEKQKVEFKAECRNIPAIAAKMHLTEEEAGRSVRYEIFENETKGKGNCVIAVAHHMDDQAETVLMNLLRGSGIRGCCGIPVKRPVSYESTTNIVRPLLCVRRCEIEAWLEANGQAWCIDETNLQTEYLRSRVRNSLMPLLEREYNIQAAEHIFEAADEFRQVHEFLQSRVDELFDSWKQDDKDRICIPRCRLKEQPLIIKRMLVMEALRRLGGVKDVGREHVESVLELLEKNGSRKIMLPNNQQACLEYEKIIFEKRKRQKKSVDESVAKSGFVTYSVFQAEEKKIQQKCCVNCLDYDTITKGLHVRTRRPGDRICIDADKNTQKLSDFMINAKIPLKDREKVKLLVTDDGVVCVEGYRVSYDNRVTNNTRLVLKVDVLR